MRLHHVRGTTQHILAACIALSTICCATTKPRHQWTEDALTAETAQFEGRLQEAEREYERLLRDPPNDDKRRWLLFNMGRVALERGDEAEARRRFQTVYDEPTRDLHGAKALYEVAKLAPAEQAVATRLAVIRRYPGQVAADFALQDIVGLHVATEDFRGLEALLSSLTSDVEGSELGDNVWFQLAQVRHVQLRAPNDALMAYRELYERYPKGPLADDALWEMANLYRAHQQWADALVLLSKLATEVEASWFIGSYDSDLVDNAMYDAGFIELVHMSNYELAAQWFRRYLKKFPDGLLNDDAAWNLVEIQRLLGDETQYQHGLESFAREYPESRYVRQVVVRLGRTP